MTYKHIQKREGVQVRTLNMIESMRQSSLDRVASTLVIESETLPDVAIARRNGKYVVVITEGGDK
jgi:hypothetical protein